MNKIDRLGWTAGIVITCYGVRVGVRVNNPDALDRLVEYLPPTWKLSPVKTVDRLYSLIVGGEGSRPGVRRLNLLYANAGRIARSAELAEGSSCTQESLDGRARQS
jgi:hypothetical protein